jgi:HIV Tat-specific factor 1
LAESLILDFILALQQGWTFISAAYVRSMASSSSSSHVNLGLVDDVIASSKPLYAPLSRVGNRIAISDNHSIPFDEQDHSVYYDRTSNAWRCEVPDNIRERGDPSELEWNGVQRKWLPVVDDSLIEAQQAAYSVPGVDESTPAAPVLRREGKRRRQDGDQNGDKKQRRRVNASIYVTGLPLDCTKEEIAKTFSRYGVLNEDDAGQPRIKMYTDEESGLFRGDALVTYFREESVELAINVLDESALRAADGKASPIMHLTRAEFGAKTDQANGNGKDQEQDKGAKQAKAAMSDADKKRLQRRFAKMNE